MPLNLPTDCDGYGKKFLVPHALSCHKGCHVVHKGCVRRTSADGQRQQDFFVTAALTRQKDLADGKGLNCLPRATKNVSWITAIPHCLNGTELSREELQDNILF